MLRTVKNYEADCNRKSFKLTGIKENSVWNDLLHFHVVNNRSADTLHDFLEGLLKLVVLQLLNNLIFVRKYFSIDTFNQRLKQHDFGPLESNTNIGLLTIEAQKKKKNQHQQTASTKKNQPQQTASTKKKLKIKTSGSEMLSLFTHLAFLIGDYVEEDIEEWDVYLRCRKVLSIVMQKVVHRNTHILLKTLISELLQLIQSVFGVYMTPKCHFITNYASIMRDVGPLPPVSSIRYESFHGIFKSVIKTINCRKNLLASSTFKIQMRLADLLLRFESFYSTDIESTKFKKVSLELVLQKYVCEIPFSDTIFSVKHATRNSVTYKVGTIVQTGLSKDLMRKFALITDVFIVDNEIFLGCQTISNLGFSKHFNAFKVEQKNFHFIKSINLKFTRFSYIFRGADGLKLVMWD